MANDLSHPSLLWIWCSQDRTWKTLEEMGIAPGGLSLLGSYGSLSALQGARPQGMTGEAYLVGADLYLWNQATSSWTKVLGLQGPPGTPGSSGAPGATGPAGLTGPPGTTPSAADLFEEIDFLVRLRDEIAAQVADLHFMVAEMRAGQMRIPVTIQAAADSPAIPLTQSVSFTIERDGASFTALQTNSAGRFDTSFEPEITYRIKALMDHLDPLLLDPPEEYVLTTSADPFPLEVNLVYLARIPCSIQLVSEDPSLPISGVMSVEIAKKGGGREVFETDGSGLLETSLSQDSVYTLTFLSDHGALFATPEPLKVVTPDTPGTPLALSAVYRVRVPLTLQVVVTDPLDLLLGGSVSLTEPVAIDFLENGERFTLLTDSTGKLETGLRPECAYEILLSGAEYGAFAFSLAAPVGFSTGNHLLPLSLTLDCVLEQKEFAFFLEGIEHIYNQDISSITTTSLGAPETGVAGIKYRGGVYAGNGRVVAIPAAAPQPLLIDTIALTATPLGDPLGSGDKFHSGVYVGDGKVVALPHNASRFLLIDADAMTATPFGPALSGSYSKGIYVGNGQVVAIPYTADHPLLIHVPTLAVAEIGEALTGPAPRYGGGVYGGQGLVLATPANASQPLLIDVNNMTAELMGTSETGTDKYNGEVSLGQSQAVAIPFLKRQPLLMDAREKQCLSFGLPLTASDTFEGGVYIGAHQLIAFPSGTTQQPCLIDPKNGDMDPIGKDWELPYVAGGLFRGGVYLGNKKALLMPAGAAHFMLVDGRERETSLLGALPPGNSLYNCGIYAGKGRAVAINALADCPLLIDTHPETDLPWPTEAEMLSNWFNTANHAID